jgi:hypothetical protein
MMNSPAIGTVMELVKASKMSPEQLVRKKCTEMGIDIDELLNAIGYCNNK